LQRDSATLSNGSCGSFGAFATLATNPVSPYSDASVASGTCYQYRYLISDNSGNQATYTSTNVAKVYTTGLGQLTNGAWAVSTPATAATGAAYTYSFNTATAAAFTSVIMTVPAGTSGTPALGTVTGVPSSGILSISGNQLTYSFSSTFLNGGTAVTIHVLGMTNTSAVGTYTAQIATTGSNVGGPSIPIDTGVTGPVSFSTSSLANASWSVSKTSTSASAVTYSYSFTTASQATLSSVTMSVPPGTSGTPSPGTVIGLPATGTISLATNLLTYSFSSTAVNAGTPVSIQVTGLTNTSLTGSDTAELTTLGTTGGPVLPVDTGITTVVSFSTSVMTVPTWTVSKTGTGASGTSYIYSFTSALGATLSSVTMTVPPGTTGSPSLGATSGIPSSGTASLSGSLLTYSYTPTYLNPSVPVSLQVTGITNTSFVGVYTSEITTNGTNSQGSSVPIDTGITNIVPLSAGVMSTPSWTVSKTTTGASSVSCNYGFTTASSATLSSVTFTVPLGTAGTPSLGTTSGLPATGALSLSGTLLTYSFTPTYESVGTAVSLQVNTLTNASSAGAYIAEVATNSTGSGGAVLPVDTGLTTVVSLSPSTMSNPIWTVSKTATGTSSVIYSYSFTTALGATLSSLTVTVPPGTAGTPALGAASGIPSNGTLLLSGSLLTYSFSAIYVNPSVPISLQVTGLTNSSVVGSYTSELATVGTVSGGNALPIDTGTSGPILLSAGTMASPSWALSKTTTGSSSLTYTYKFTTASSATLSSLTMTVPTGTGGTPALGSVSGLPASGTLALSANTLTYSFTATVVGPGTAVSLQVTGMTNTSTAGYYIAELASIAASGPIDTGLSAPVALSPGSLAGPTWTTSKSGVGATAVTYTYNFTTGTGAALSYVTMTVPAGTAGTPSLGTVTGLPGGGTLSLSGNLLTYSFGSVWYNGGSPVTITVTGLTNTSTAGSYTAELATDGTNSGAPVLPMDTGTTSAVVFS